MKQRSFQFGAPAGFVPDGPSETALEFARREGMPPDDQCNLCLFGGNKVPDPDCEWCHGSGVFNP